MTDWRRILRACRQNLGSRTGEFWQENRRRFEIPAVDRLPKTDPLAQLWDDQAELFTHGEVQLAAIVMANTNLFRRAWIGAPALVVHGPGFEDESELLRRIADQIYDVKHDDDDVDGVGPELIALVRDEMSRKSWVRVPPSLAGDRECWATSVFIPRGALPDGYLAGHELPVVVARERTPMIAVLPASLWPEDLVREWRERKPEPDPPCEDHESVLIKGYNWPVPVLVGVGIYARPLFARIATGDRHAYDESTGWMAVSYAIAGALVLAFDFYSRRASPPRYFSPACGHAIEVRYDRRLLWLQPRVWAWLLLGCAAFLAIGAAVRG